MHCLIQGSGISPHSCMTVSIQDHTCLPHHALSDHRLVRQTWIQIHNSKSLTQALGVSKHGIHSWILLSLMRHALTRAHLQILTNTCDPMSLPAGRVLTLNASKCSHPCWFGVCIHVYSKVLNMLMVVKACTQAMESKHAGLCHTCTQARYQELDASECNDTLHHLTGPMLTVFTAMQQAKRKRCSAPLTQEEWVSGHECQTTSQVRWNAFLQPRHPHATGANSKCGAVLADWPLVCAKHR